MDEEAKTGVCPSCRTPLSADDETCPTCGHDVEGAARHSKYQRETEDRPGPRVSGPGSEEEDRAGN